MFALLILSTEILVWLECALEMTIPVPCIDNSQLFFPPAPTRAAVKLQLSSYSLSLKVWWFSTFDLAKTASFGGVLRIF